MDARAGSAACSAALGAERVADQLREPPEKLSAHAGMEAVAVSAAERQQPERALVTEGYQRHRAQLGAFRAEQEFALRVTRLAAARLAAREQRLEGFQVRIIRPYRAHEARGPRVRLAADEHQRGVEGIEILAQSG